MKTINRARTGSALIMALSCALIIGGIGGTAFMVVQSKVRAVQQSASWDQALFAAEGGVDMAMEEIRKGLYTPESAWKDWTLETKSATAEAVPGAGLPAAEKIYSVIAPSLTRNEEGSRRSWAEVTVDFPECLKDSAGEQWCRIRSLGAADIPGGRVVAGDKVDTTLRKFSLVSDRHTGKRVAGPQSTRVVVAIAKPVGAFRLAIMGIDSIDLTDKNIVIDSYDSRDAEKSTNGAYDPAKRQEHGDIATNGEVINAGSAQIYGDAMTNGGTVLNSENVAGEIRNDFYQSAFAVRRPNTIADTGTPTVVTRSETFVATPGKPSNYQLSAVTLSGSDVLRVQGAADGSPTYIQIVVTGDLRITGGQAAIQLDPGVFARIFVEGDADVAGRGILNPGTPLHLQIYGVEPAAGESRELKIAGSAGFSGAVYAPAFDVSIVGGGNGDSVYGCVVGKKVSMTGIQSLHYDQALSQAGIITDYKIASWFEDER
jgi:hypothetical protein